MPDNGLSGTGGKDHAAQDPRITQRRVKTMDLIEKYEAEEKIIVLRPSELIRMKRVEKNKNKLQRMYDLGVCDCTSKLDKIKEYISG